jgi:NitT/TauT family transport system substrate-binding protein
MKKFRKLALILSAVLAVSALAVGCSSTKEAATETKSAESKTVEVKKLKVGYATGSGALYPFIADDKGIFKEEGIEVELVPFTNSSDALNALSAGKIDIGMSFGTGGPLTFITNGVDFTLFGGSLSGGHPIYATKEAAAEYKGIESFKGKKVASPRIYTPDIVWRSAVYNENIDIKKDLNLIEMKKPTEVVEAVKAGKVDYGIGTISSYTAAQEAGLAIVGWSNDLWPNHVCCRQVAKTEFLNDNKDTVEAFMRALLKAEKIFAEDSEYGVDVNKRYLKIDEKLARELTLEEHQIYENDPNKKGIVEMWDMMNKIEYLESDIDITKNINTEIYKSALDELRKANPEDKFYEKLEERFNHDN